MIPAMYNDIRLSQSMLDEADQDTSLEVSSGLSTGKSRQIVKRSGIEVLEKNVFLRERESTNQALIKCQSHLGVSICSCIHVSYQSPWPFT